MQAATTNQRIIPSSLSDLNNTYHMEKDLYSIKSNFITPYVNVFAASSVTKTFFLIDEILLMVYWMFGH